MTIAGLMEETVGLPDGVSARLDGNDLTIKGPRGELTRRFYHPRLTMEVSEGVKISTEYPRRAQKALFGTWRAHVNNMVKGVLEGFEYNMKIVYSHFPIKTSVKTTDGRRELVIENFLGERHPRRAAIIGDTEVKVSGDQVILIGSDIEKVGQSAANIEQATRIRKYDIRVFQDGIYITKKG